MTDWINLLQRLFSWFSERRNSARQQAARVLATFEAHGISRTEINALLPEALQLTAYQWSNADQLKLALRQQHLNWINEYFALQDGWLTGQSESAHQHVFSYKSPAKLHQWFQKKRTPGVDLEFRLHLITPDTREIGPDSEGYYALVMEQMDDGLERCSRFYHLSEGGHFEHWPCLIHLMQVLAIAHHHGVIMRRAQLDTPALYKLSHHQGLIPDWLHKCRPHPLQADHELWPHFSGHSPWLEQLRSDAEQGLRHAGLSEVLTTWHADVQRFARQQPITDRLLRPHNAPKTEATTRCQ
ncbi:hypothetical protein [Pseudomonas sp. 5P_3.1_Bac2]|uniref:hypothetical protein n=1 Tax=Pseudomonas sp. 5P_3.1_Bac2 TaxID=2971617 RepID=UPI0021CA6140|nr:hypothetical protein [Pseudomonas sp. 5P_3.1_Bac2]MCU1718181.1 hypothetical protein [Pseudomonas sp. 5P_3.1_Bac2]